MLNHQIDFEKVIVLKKTSLFSTVSTRDLRVVAGITQELEFAASDFIVKEGEVGDSLYIIKMGRVQVLKKINDNETVTLAELSAGQSFGEMAVIDEEVRSADVKALEKCILLCIRRNDLLDVLLEYSQIGIEMLKIFVKRLRDTNSRMGKK